jgi:hypothetical protein
MPPHDAARKEEQERREEAYRELRRAYEDLGRARLSVAYAAEKLEETLIKYRNIIPAEQMRKEVDG